MKRAVLCLLALIAMPSQSWAAENVPFHGSQEACLKKAEEFPDVAQAEAEIWVRKGGGFNARLCRAVAAFNRASFAFAAPEFESLAKMYEKQNKRQAAKLYDQSGLAYLRADDRKKAEVVFSSALRLEPHNPDYLLDRATLRASDERYWEAIDDANKALNIMPDLEDALKIRANCWMKLGLSSNAKSDFTRIEALKNMDAALDKKK